MCITRAVINGMLFDSSSKIRTALNRGIRVKGGDKLPGD